MSSRSKVDVVVEQLRTIVNQATQPTISSRQVKSRQRRPARTSEWVSRIVLPKPTEDLILSILLKAIKELGDGNEDFVPPSIEPVEAEWVGHRKRTDNDYPDSHLSEPQKYERLVQDCRSELTIIYLHGGGYFQGSPDESRTTTAALARMTGGKCLSVGYRLAPQNSFPAAILDSLIAYFSLLSPAPGCAHKPIPASSIVLSGDSAGATLCFALIQVINHFRRQSAPLEPRIIFHGTQIGVPLPAGLAAISAYGDLTHSMPSWLANAKKDYLPTINPTLWPSFPACDIWPSSPPRVNVFCNDTVLHHPLASPVAVADWSDFPPLWLCYGEEMMADEGKVIAQRAARQGATVVWEQYSAMPHCFALLPPLSRLPGAQQAFEKWAEFCTMCVYKPRTARTRGTFTQEGSLEETPVDVGNLIDLDYDQVKRRMQEARVSAIDTLAQIVRSGPKL